jgi:PAS domain-containing protein
MLKCIIGGYYFRPGGNIVARNNDIFTIWGYISPEEYPEKMEGANITDFIKPINSINELLRQVQKLGHIEVYEFPYFTHKGEVKWAKIEGWVLKEEGNTVISGWIWIDITPICSKSNNELVEILKDTMNFIFQDIPLLYFLWEINEDFTTRILGINKEGKKILNYTSSEVLGKIFYNG